MKKFLSISLASGIALIGAISSCAGVSLSPTYDNDSVTIMCTSATEYHVIGVSYLDIEAPDSGVIDSWPVGVPDDPWKDCRFTGGGKQNFFAHNEKNFNSLTFNQATGGPILRLELQKFGDTIGSADWVTGVTHADYHYFFTKNTPPIKIKSIERSGNNYKVYYDIYPPVSILYPSRDAGQQPTSISAGDIKFSLQLKNGDADFGEAQEIDATAASKSFTVEMPGSTSVNALTVDVSEVTGSYVHFVPYKIEKADWGQFKQVKMSSDSRRPSRYSSANSTRQHSRAGELAGNTHVCQGIGCPKWHVPAFDVFNKVKTNEIVLSAKAIEPNCQYYFGYVIFSNSPICEYCRCGKKAIAEEVLAHNTDGTATVPAIPQMFAARGKFTKQWFVTITGSHGEDPVTIYHSA